jgi:hypothetical protein
MHAPTPWRLWGGSCTWHSYPGWPILSYFVHFVYVTLGLKDHHNYPRLFFSLWKYKYATLVWIRKNLESDGGVDVPIYIYIYIYSPTSCFSLLCLEGSKELEVFGVERRDRWIASFPWWPDGHIENSLCTQASWWHESSLERLDGFWGRTSFIVSFIIYSSR